MKENPSILAELKDLLDEVNTSIEEGDIETAVAFIEQFILLENEGGFSVQSEVQNTPVWDVYAPTILLSADKIPERVRMKAYTDPDFGPGAVVPLMGNTGVSLKEKLSAVITYLDVGGCLTIRREDGVMYMANHSTPETLRGGADLTVTVGLSLSESFHGTIIPLPAESFMVMATSKWISVIPAEKERFSLKTFEGGQLFEY